MKTVSILYKHAVEINTVDRMSDHRTLAWSMMAFAFYRSQFVLNVAN